MKIKIIIVAIVAAGFAVMKLLAKRRAAQLEARGGCVSCGSTNLATDGTTRTCLDCGYQGRVDGGGALSSHEIDALYRDEPRDTY